MKRILNEPKIQKYIEEMVNLNFQAIIQKKQFEANAQYKNHNYNYQSKHTLEGKALQRHGLGNQHRRHSDNNYNFGNYYDHNQAAYGSTCPRHYLRDQMSNYHMNRQRSDFDPRKSSLKKSKKLFFAKNNYSKSEILDAFPQKIFNFQDPRRSPTNVSYEVRSTKVSKDVLDLIHKYKFIYLFNHNNGKISFINFYNNLEKVHPIMNQN